MFAEPDELPVPQTFAARIPFPLEIIFFAIHKEFLV